MELIKFSQSEEFKNSDTCTVREFPSQDKDINFSTGVITGRYPEKGYCMNKECKELIYIIEGKGILNKKEESIVFEQGDVIIIEKGEAYYWDANCKVIMPCTPAWYPEQHIMIEE